MAASNDAFMVGRGYGPELRLFSHSQGYDMVERPLTRFNEDMTVMAGMNFAIHPGSVQADVNALICDNYMIAADGAEKLHRTSTDIVVL